MKSPYNSIKRTQKTQLKNWQVKEIPQQNKSQNGSQYIKRGLNSLFLRKIQLNHNEIPLHNY